MPSELTTLSLKLEDYLMICWPGCDDCELLKDVFQQLDHFTLSPDAGRVVDQAIKKLIKAPQEFPFLINKKTGAIIPRKLIEPWIELADRLSKL